MARLMEHRRVFFFFLHPGSQAHLSQRERLRQSLGSKETCKNRKVVKANV